MRYKFNFRYTTISNEYNDYPVIITAMDDSTAYAMALYAFRDHIKFEEDSLHIKFTAPETMTILMRKELP